MARSVLVRASLVRAVLLGTTALAVFNSPFIVGDASAKVGITSAADGSPLGKPPNENERVLRIGIDIQANEQVTTGTNDRAHLLFLDGSSLTVGPNAQLTIDRFVFDPATKTGDLAVSASKGVFRLVGGKISKNNPITITTPSATIGIRGGIAIFTVTQLKTTSDFVFGNSMSVSAMGQTQTATRAGSQIVTSAGSGPGAPTMTKQGSLNAALGQLEGKSSSSSSSGSSAGGADAAAQKSGISNVNSGQSFNPPIATLGLPLNSNNNPATNAIANVGPLTQPGESTPTDPKQPTAGPSPTPSPGPTPTPGPTPGPTPTPTPTPTVIISQGRFLADPPYKENTFNPKKLSAERDAANNAPLVPTASVLNSIVTITIQGGNTLQVPWLPGQIFSFSGATPLGPATGVGFVDQAGQFFAYSMTTSNNQRFGVFGGTQTAKTNFPKNAVGAHELINLAKPGDLPFAPTSIGGDAQLKDAANVSPLYTKYGADPSSSKGLQVTISVAGTGAAQKSYMGVMIADYGVDPSNNTLYSNGIYAGSARMGGDQKIIRTASNLATADTGQGTAIYGDTGQFMAYTPDKLKQTGSGVTRTTGAGLEKPYSNSPGSSYYPVTAAVPATTNVSPTIGQTRTEQTMVGYAAGLVDYKSGNTYTTKVPIALFARPGDVTITTDPATNQALGKIVLRGYDGSLFSPNELTLQLGGGSGRNGQPTSAFIDNNTYAMTTQDGDRHRRSKYEQDGHRYRVKDNTVLASANAAPVTLPGTIPCTCEYLSWGWWSTDTKIKNGPNAGDELRVNMGTYVVGRLTTPIEMPRTGSATYTGLMAGNVNNRGNSYIAGGNYSMNYNYALRAGTTSMTFDNRSYGGGVVASNADGTNFVGAFAGGRRVGSMSGSFYGPGAANQGGTFSIGTNGSNYQASGIFAGQK